MASSINHEAARLSSLHHALAFSVLYPHTILNTILVPNTLRFRTSLSMKTKFHTHKRRRGKIFFYLGCKRNIKVSWLKSSRNSPKLLFFQFLYVCRLRFILSLPNLLLLMCFQNIFCIYLCCKFFPELCLRYMNTNLVLWSLVLDRSFFFRQGISVVCFLILRDFI